MTQRDISDILAEWPYEETRAARVVYAQDGTRKLQVRLPLGIEQMEWEGRPDGKPDLLTQAEQRARACREEAGPDEKGFALTDRELAELAAEGTLYYRRYVAFFDAGFYQEVVRDTARNLRLFAFCEQYEPEPGASDMICQYRPYVLRMKHHAQALVHIESGQWERGRQVVDEAAELVERCRDVATEIFTFEKQRSLVVLGKLRDEIIAHKPVEPADVAHLKRILEQAVAEEDYERAAVIRDKIQAARRTGRDGDGG